MCDTLENSLAANIQRAEEDFLAAKLTQAEMIGRIAAAENAQRAYRALMDEAGWTPEKLLAVTGYRILTPQNQLTI